MIKTSLERNASALLFFFFLKCYLSLLKEVFLTCHSKANLEQKERYKAGNFNGVSRQCIIFFNATRRSSPSLCKLRYVFSTVVRLNRCFSVRGYLPMRFAIVLNVVFTVHVDCFIERSIYSSSHNVVERAADAV